MASKVDASNWLRSPVLDWDLFFFHLSRPGGTIVVGIISIVHSLFHLPHCLLYRRLGILTAFWSVVGVGLVFAAVTDTEVFYDVWIWYSLVYVPVMLVLMAMVLTSSVWGVELKMLRALFATIAIIFYLFMFYCIVFVSSEKRKIFTPPPPECPQCPDCPPKKSGDGRRAKGLLRFLENRF